MKKKEKNGRDGVFGTGKNRTGIVCNFSSSQKLLMKMDEGLMGNFLTRLLNLRERKNEPKEDGKEKKNVSRISYVYRYIPGIGRGGYIHLYINEESQFVWVSTLVFFVFRYYGVSEIF
ncbi:hypothetical protein CEXT_521651 [Caerostris extrusa]|uniref:Uncharacterized protein n=1 Tax=Caerostris extrusa TaxID=172846 RepID=A0AAV4STA0_CAEEX|nr:hypothetical protein CEXT_521651 [Caerostris extrusa]